MRWLLLKEIVDGNCQETDIPLVIQMSQHPGHLLQDKAAAAAAAVNYISVSNLYVCSK